MRQRALHERHPVLKVVEGLPAGVLRCLYALYGGPGGVGVGFGCPGGVVDDEATLLVASSPPHLDGWERLGQRGEGRE